jgi:hypothetical protein
MYTGGIYYMRYVFDYYVSTRYIMMVHCPRCCSTTCITIKSPSGRHVVCCMLFNAAIAVYQQAIFIANPFVLQSQA